MLGFFGGVEVINTKVKHGKHKVADGGNRGWDGLPWYQNIGRGYPSWRLMVHWWFIEGRGEYATWTGIGSVIDGPVITVLELIEERNLNQLTQ